MAVKIPCHIDTALMNTASVLLTPDFFGSLLALGLRADRLFLPQSF